MSAIDTYIIRTTLLAFLIILVSLTGIIWITQALREIDLLTNGGQTILVFLGISSLIVAPLALVIAPIALLIAVTITINRLASESEIIVMNAAGLSPFRLFRPFLIATAFVSMFVAFLAGFGAPGSLRAFRDWQREIGADVLTNVLRPGQFINLNLLTIRAEKRFPGGKLSEIFIDDQRNPAERIDIVAENGVVQKTENGSFLVLQNGNLQRFEIGKKEPIIVQFTSYAFDFSQFSNSTRNGPLIARERTMSELFGATSDDPIEKQAPGSLRAEFHDRLFSPLYPIAFVLIAFAILAPPRSTRQGRNFAVGVLIATILVVRILGYALTVVAPALPLAIIFQYLLLATVAATSCGILFRGVIIDTPTKLVELNNSILRLFKFRTA